MSLSQRQETLREQRALMREEIAALSGQGIDPAIAEHLIENAVGYFPIPLVVATGFRIDGTERVVPMALEDPSLAARTSRVAEWVSARGTLTTSMNGNLIIGQIQLPRVPDPIHACSRLECAVPRLIEAANRLLPGIVSRGGGVRRIAIRRVERPAPACGQMIVLHVLCDPCDAMGANVINQVCEALKPEVEEAAGCAVGLCILSNLVDGKLAQAEARLRGVEPALAERVREASLFAEADPYRAATHNKSVLDGIDPVLLATGNDWRAVEAGAHAYAARSGRYRPVAAWTLEGDELVGRIEIPMSVGTVGGVTRLHPAARVALKILGAERSDELARICAAVGLVSNLGALMGAVM